MKQSLILLLTVTILHAVETTDEQKQMREILLRLNVPILEMNKNIKTCLLSKSQEEYTICMEKTREIFKRTDLGKAVTYKKDKTPFLNWNDKEKREEALKKVNEHISKLQAEIECANDPKTKDYMSCVE